MKKKSLKLLASLIAVGFSVSMLSACDNILDFLQNSSDSSSSSVDEKDWGEIWENWGKDDWLDGDYEEYDPSQNYNKIDWTAKYPGLKSEKATDVTPSMTIYESQHVQLLQAEKAILSGAAKVENGHHVGYFQDGASVTWTVQSEAERNMLLVVNTSSPESENRYGLSMLDSYVVSVNGQDVDVSDGWIKSTKDWNTFVENVLGECKLQKGENVITIKSTGGTNLDYLKLIPEGALSDEELIVQVPGIKYTSMGLKVEAEEMEYVGADVYNQGSGGILGSTSSATSVSAYIEASEETKVQFVLNGLFRVDDGSYPANAAQRFTFKLNGKEVDLSGATLKGIGDQDNWYKEPYTNNKLAEITLKKGTNEIEFSLKTGEINLDYFKFLPLGMDVDAEIVTSYDNTYSDGVKVQVEDTKHSGATVQKAASGKILGITSSATSLEFILKAEEATNVEFILNGLFRVDDNYSGIAGDRFVLIVNDVEVDLSAKTLIGSENLEQWWVGTYSSNSFGNIALKEGENTIQLSLKTGEINLDYIQFKQAACEHEFATEWTTDGEYHWHEALCGHDEAVEKLPHDWKDATCTEAKTCKTCGKTEGNALGHDEVEHEGQAATCTEKGWKEYVTCTRCDYTTYEEIPATGHTDKDSNYKCDDCGIALCTEHTEETLFAQKATCTETGLTEGKKCSICGEILVAQEVIPALGHTEEIIAGQAATCTEAGLTDGKKCSVCGETLVEQEEISALGHKEEIMPSKEATYAEAGLTEGKKCSVCGEILVAQEEIPALAYEYADGLKVEVENTAYTNATVQSAASGSILGITSDQTKVSFIVKATESKTVEFVLNALLKLDASYSAVTGDRFALTVNGNEIDLSAQTLTGSDNAAQWWLGAYATNNFGKIALKEGENTITLALKTDEINLDYIMFMPEGSIVQDPYTYDYSNGMKVEMEETKYSGATVQSGASGSILGITSSATKVEFTVVANQATYAEVILNGLIRVDAEYSSNAAYRFALTVNGTAVDLSAQTLVGSDNEEMWWLGTYTTSSFGSIALTEGKNTIVLTLKTGEINLDYITLVAGEAPEKEAFTYDYSEGMKVELEDTNFSGATVQSGASGSILGITSSATKVEFNVVAEEGTQVEFILNGLFKVDDSYSGIAGDRFVLIVNDVEVDLSAKTLIGSDNEEKWWLGTYTTNSFGNITLKEGKNVICLSLKTDEINLDYIQLKQAVCEHKFATEWTTDGEYHWYEALCGHDEAVEKLPHVWKDATCTEAKTCETCGKTEGNALGHDEVEHKGQAATCTEKGWKEYVTCTRCDDTTYEELPATGHKDENSDYKCDVCTANLCTVHEEETIPAQKATCTESGLTEGKKCSLCGEILVAQTVVSALGHTEEIVAGKAATCTEAGLTDGKKCSVCGETLVAQEEISALGHKEEIMSSKEPTYAEAGLTEGKKCSVCGEILVAQEEIPALAYEYADGLKVEVENTTYINSYTQTGYGTGMILGGTSDQTKVSFIVKAAESKTVEFVLNALIKVDASYSGVTGDRFTLTVNGEEVDLSAKTLLGSNNEAEWWKGLFTNNSFGKVTLQKGENLFVLSLKTNEMNLDYISFVAEGSEVEDPYAFDYSDGMKVELEETNFGDATVQDGASGKILGITSSATNLAFSIVAEEETTVELFLNGLFKVDDSYSASAGDRFVLTVNGVAVDLSAQTLVGSDNADQWWLGAYTTNSFGNITLKEGKNTITLALKTNEINLDYMQLRAAGTVVEDPFTFDYSDGMKVELEETNFSGATVQNGASGSILGITTNATKLEFTVVAEEETTVELFLNGLFKVDDSYSGIAGDRFVLTVNGVAVDLSAKTLLGSDNKEMWWLGAYTTNSFGNITLQKGNNTITLSLKTNEINLDYMQLLAAGTIVKDPYAFDYSDGMKVELEETNFSGATIQDGASGKILGITTDATKLTFTVVTEEETTVELFLNGLFKVDDSYSGIAGDRFVLTVNGVAVDLSAKTLVGSDNAEKWWLGSYTTNSFGNITLQKGNNTITLSLKTNEINLDYIQLN